MIRLAIRCRADQAETALAQLMELAPAGVEEVRDGDIVEYAVYGPPGEIPELPDLQAAVGDSLVEVTTTEVADDWHERWRQFHRPVLIGDDERGYVLLRPSWETGEGDGGEVDGPLAEAAGAAGVAGADGAHASATEPSVVVIELDPGQAFGTGSHPTTRLCVELLLDVAPGGGRGGERGGSPGGSPGDALGGSPESVREVVDLGCGSGVLAIAAGKLGFGPLRCYDFDPLSVEATEENALRNNVRLSVERADLRDGLPPTAPVVLANLLRPLLLEVAAGLGAGLATGPGTTGPGATGSGTTGPGATGPSTTGSGATGPSTTGPGTTGSGAAGSGATGPGTDAIETMILSGLLDEEADEIAAAYGELGLSERRRVSEGGWTALLLVRL